MFKKTQSNEIVDPKQLTQREMTRNARSMQRRLYTPITLKYKWHLISLIAIAFGVFVLFHKLLYIMLEQTATKTWFNYITTAKPVIKYDTVVMRSIYYIDGATLDFLFKPSILALITGIAMFIIRKYTYKKYVANEIAKLKK